MMKSRIFSALQMALLVTLPPSLGTALGQQPAIQSYDVINLGTPLGGSFAISAGIGTAGFLGGYANLPGDKSQHAILWLPGSTRDLGTFGGANSALLNQFAGFSETATTDSLGQDFCGTGTHLVCLPLAAQYGSPTALPLLGGINGAAFGNNLVGQVAGVSQTAAIDPSCLVSGKPVAPFFQSQQSVPVLWTFGLAQQLPLPTGDSEGSANAINDLGQATGSTGDCVTAPTAHGVLWKNGIAVNLGNLGGAANTNPFAINDLTQVTGTSDLAGDLTSHAFLWQNGVMQDLGTLPGDYYSVGYAINNSSQIVGQSCDANFNCRAFLWQKGTMTDLNALIPKNSALYLYLAATIDDLGEVAGYAVDKTANNSPAFVAVPGFSFGSQEASIAAPRVEAVPRVSLPESVRMQTRQNLRTIRATRQIAPR
jgi:probable HAF family extracellular repeat protein